MGIPAKSPRVLRFGVFEVDLQACELRKAGLKVKLQVQPFQVLVALLERPGEVVTRDDLRQRLWPTGTFVDFDHSLNSAIKKLRLALGDDSESPRYIETLHRRGYRLIVPVATALPRLASINETPANLHSENTVHGRSSPEEESSPLQNSLLGALL
jgi:DNA-binding winged helix-turn-helix (wHTH) protein